MNRGFVRRAVLFMVRAGIRQFLDLGCGILTVGTVHEIAHQVDPACRVVYVDVESLAVAHSQFVLQNNDCAVIVAADLTEPDTVLHATPTQRMLDVTQPVGLLATAVGHHIGPDRNPQAVFTRYQAAFPAGSYLAITHAASDFVTEHSQKATALAAPQLTGFLRDWTAPALMET